jgi:hypothetical protein
MNNTTRKTSIAAAALLTGVCAATGGAALAGTGHSSSAPRTHASSVRPSHAHRLDGTWRTAVTLTDAPPGAPASFQALDTFQRGGGLLVSSSAPNPSSRGLAHGMWSQHGKRTYSSTFVWFRFDPAGLPIGTQQVTRKMTLSRSQKTFHATDVVTIIDPAGTVLATIHGTEVGHLLG